MKKTLLDKFVDAFRTLLDKFVDAFQTQPTSSELMEHIPLFRYPANYGYMAPQLDLVKAFGGHYLLEWIIPGEMNRQTNIHIIKNVTKEELQKLFLDTSLGDLMLFDVFNPNDGDAYHNLEMAPIDVDNYYEIAKLEPINRYLIKTRLNNIINQPLLASNNVVTNNIYNIKTMLQYSRKD